jgi:hypothetical protein
MAKLKDHIIKQEEFLHHIVKQEEFLFKSDGANRVWRNPVSIHKHNNLKHQSTQTWSADMPDLEGEALADAEK